MKLTVVVRPKASVGKVEIQDDGSFKVWVREPADKGMANKAVTKALAQHFDVSVSRVNIISGGTSSKKIIEII